MRAGTAGEASGPGGRAAAARAGRGDGTVAVTGLFRDHHLELVRLALVMVGDLATAEDVVQDAFERLHRGWPGLRQPSSGLAYVRSSVLNGCRSDGSYPRALLTPDGTAVITSTAQNIRAGSGRITVVARIVELSASTGRLIRVLHVARERTIPGLRDVGSLDDACSVLSLGPAGVHALVQCFGFGRLDGDRFTPLPGVPDPSAITLRGPDFWGAGAW